MRVDRVTVAAGEIAARVVFDPGEHERVDAYPHACERALALLPGLRGHRCDNDTGARFPDELATTEVAHLLEHATLEIMTLAGSPPTVRGRTSWDPRRDGAGVYEVRITFDDDLVALGALKAAEAAVRWCLTGDGHAPDVRAEALRLRELRRR